MAFFSARASGATLREAVAAAGVSKTTGHYWLKESGGTRPRRTRPRPALRLSVEERETISRGLAQRKTLTAIAAELGRSVSTVSREVGRNSGPNGYRAAGADRLATVRQGRPRPGKLATTPVLRTYMEDKLRLCWSPQQISRRLELDFPSDPRMRVSHETIYTSLFVQAKAVLSGELTGQLRTRRVRRRPHRRAKCAGPVRGCFVLVGDTGFKPVTSSVCQASSTGPQRCADVRVSTNQSPNLRVDPPRYTVVVKQLVKQPRLCGVPLRSSGRAGALALSALLLERHSLLSLLAAPPAAEAWVTCA